jgi:hypothetical protein
MPAGKLSTFPAEGLILASVDDCKWPFPGANVLTVQSVKSSVSLDSRAQTAPLCAGKGQAKAAGIPGCRGLTSLAPVLRIRRAWTHKLNWKNDCNLKL